MVEVSPKGVAPRVCGTVSQIFNLQADRIYLHRLASLIRLQDEILRYSRLKTCATFRLKTCATFRCGPQTPHPRNRGNPHLVLATPGSGFGFYPAVRPVPTAVEIRRSLVLSAIAA